MEEEFQLITTLFNWTMGHSWKLQTPLTVLTSCTILHCQSTSQPTTVQDTVIPSHLTLSISHVSNCGLWCHFFSFSPDSKNFATSTSSMSSTMLTETSPPVVLSAGVPVAFGVLLFIITGLVILTTIYLIHRKHSETCTSK